MVARPHGEVLCAIVHSAYDDLELVAPLASGARLVPHFAFDFMHFREGSYQIISKTQS